MLDKNAIISDSRKSSTLKYPNHVTSYYVQPCVAVHVLWVKALAEFKKTTTISKYAGLNCSNQQVW